MYHLSQMAEELKTMGTDLRALTDQEIKDTFYRIVSKAVRDLERDIGEVS